MVISRLKSYFKLFSTALRYYSRRIILKLFNVNIWHQSFLTHRDYAVAIVELEGKVNYETLVDIGCGLGEISSKLKSERKYLIDSDESVYKLLLIKNFFSILRGKILIFKRIWDIKFKINNNGLFLLLNFSHNLYFDELKEMIDWCLSFGKNSIIYVDTVNNDLYRFNHTEKIKQEYNYLSIELVGDFSGGRLLWRLSNNKKGI